MEISYDNLVRLVGEAYERGLSGCADLKQQELEELFQYHKIRDNNDFKVWRTEELKKMPDGSIFQHLIRGRCYVVSRANGTKFVQFDRGEAIDLNSDSDPWDKPMRLLYSEK